MIVMRYAIYSFNMKNISSYHEKESYCSHKANNKKNCPGY